MVGCAVPQVRVWLVVLAGLAVDRTAWADDLGTDLGADAIVVVPYGDWATRTAVGFGASARVRVPISSDTTVTARLTGIAHLPRTLDIAGAPATARVLEFPLLGGARYRVTGPGRLRGFAFGELGVIFRRTDVEFGGAHDADVKIVFGSALGAGVSFDRFEVTVAVWLPDLAEVDHTAGAIVSAGGAFARW